MSTVNLACVVESDYSIKQDADFYSTLTEVTYDGTNKLFSIRKYFSLSDIERDFEDNKFDEYLYFEDGTIKLKATNDSSDAIVTKAFLEQYFETKLLITKATENGLTEEMINSMVDSLLNDYSYLENIKDGSDTNPFVISFYGLIAMMCMFASYFGVSNIYETRADLSSLGIRVSISPVHRLKLISLYTLAALTLSVISNTIFFIFLKYILGVGFGTSDILILIAMYLGSFAGISFGMVTSCLIKCSADKLTNINTAVSLVLCFLSGMMGVDIKHMIDTSAPMINIINPAGALSNALYCLYYYDNLDLYVTSIASLSIASFVFIAVTYFRTRGEKYDSI